MKRSEYDKFVQEAVDAEMRHLETEMKEIYAQSESLTDSIARLIALLSSELPAMSARISTSVVESSGLIQFDPE